MLDLTVTVGGVTASIATEDHDASFDVIETLLRIAGQRAYTVYMGLPEPERVGVDDDSEDAS